MQMLQEITVDTLVEEEKEIPREEMETESILHDNLDFDILTKAELFYTRFEGKEGKDVWTSFDIFETNSIDMTKLDNLIFQKSKDFYTLEKRRGSSIKCFGLIFTEEDVKTSWVNRKLEDLKIVLPTNFEELEQFKDGHLLECFQNMDKEAINYETKALHFSAHMFFEKPEVKKALYNAVKKFAFKNQSDSKKTQRLHTVLSKKENDRLIIDEETSETGLGFVDKFVSIFNIWKKMEKARSEIKAKNWCNSYPHIWGNELYNRSVSISNPFFEKLFLPVMINLTESDRERGSMFLVMSLKAQINALKLMMNTEYLIFMNITRNSSVRNALSMFLSL